MSRLVSEKEEEKEKDDEDEADEEEDKKEEYILLSFEILSPWGNSAFELSQ